MKMREFLDRYIHVRKCGGCRAILPYERCRDAFCSDCYLKWSVAKTENCPECFRPAYECACMPKGLSGAGALCLRKLVFYRAKRSADPQNKIIYFLKRNPNRRMAGFLAYELVRAIDAELAVLGVEDRKCETVLTYVPRGRRARNTYGFDQSELVCREISARCRMPYETVIRRKMGGKEQKKLDRAKRFRNIRHLFEMAEPEAVEGKYVLLFDDVVTTGASMAACVHLLMRAGAKGVICLCVAQD